MEGGVVFEGEEGTKTEGEGCRFGDQNFAKS